MADFDISVVAPCLNEELNVPILTNRLFDAAHSAQVRVEVIFVDDGSSDDTWNAIETVRTAYPNNVSGIRHLSNLGIPTGWRSGISVARGRVVCLTDSDLQNPPESVLDLYRAYCESGADLVRGVRVPSGNQSWSRKFMSHILNSILNVVFGMHARDNKSGFVLGPRHVIDAITKFSGHYHHAQTFLGVAAHYQRLDVLELDTPFEERCHGRSFLTGKSFSVAKLAFQDILKARREFPRISTKGTSL